MGRKRKGNYGWELLRYSGLRLVLEGTPDPARDRGSWILFVRPAAYVSPFIIKERPLEEAASIDVPLPSCMREEEVGLCSDVPPAVQPPEGNDPPQPQEDLPPSEGTLTYVP